MYITQLIMKKRLIYRNESLYTPLALFIRSKVFLRVWPGSSGVEQRTENPRVGSSNLPLATTFPIVCLGGEIGKHAGLRNQCRKT